MFAGGLRGSTEAVLRTELRGSPEMVVGPERPLPRMMIGATRRDVVAAGAPDTVGCGALPEEDAVGDRVLVVRDACWPTNEVGRVVVVGRTTVGAGAGG